MLKNGLCPASNLSTLTLTPVPSTALIYLSCHRGKSTSSLVVSKYVTRARTAKQGTVTSPVMAAALCLTSSAAISSASSRGATSG